MDGLVIAVSVLWVLVLVLAVAVFALARQVGVLFGIDGVTNRILRFVIDAESRAALPAGEIKLGETAALIEAPQ